MLAPGLGPGVALAPIPLLACALRGRPARAALEGWLCGLVFFGAGFAWVLGVRGDIAVPASVYATGVAVLAVFVALFAAGVSALARRLGAAVALLAAPGLWVSLEWLRSQGPLGAPFLWLGSALADHPLLIQCADLGGVFGLSAWVVAIAAALVAAGTPRWRPALACLAPLLAAPLAYGAWWLAAPGPDTAGSAEAFRVAAVQPNVAEEDRYEPEHFDATLRRLLALSREAAGDEPDLIVWPETAYERPVQRGDPFLGAIANGLGRPLLTGVLRIPTPEGETVRNSVVLALPGGEARSVADKVHPVPVYESAPPSLLGFLDAWPGRTEAAAAPEPVPIPRRGADPLPVGVLICFDASHTDVARGLRRAGARLLVGVYNEAQSSRWVARQHELFARLRAVENRTPLVRVANTGRSAWIDARGRILDALPADVAAAGSASLRPARGRSPYTLWGDAPVLALGLVVPAAVRLRPRPRTRSRLPIGEPA